MIGGWFARRSDVALLEGRTAALERELGDMRTLVSMLTERIAVAERTAADAAAVRDVSHRRLAIMTRALRAGGNRLHTALRSIEEHDLQGTELSDEIERIRKAMLILETRIEADAEAARRTGSALLERIERTRGKAVDSAHG